jgi:hypothetical protein
MRNNEGLARLVRQMAQIQSHSAQIGELREAAEQARAVADFVRNPADKRSFLEMARKWDAEADALEAAPPD